MPKKNSQSKMPVWKALAYVVLAILAIYLLIPHQTVPPTDTAVQTQQVTYQGVNGKTALDLLKANHQVSTTQFSSGEFVDSIDGINPPTGYFWAFYVNGQLSNTGAGNYQTKSTDVITWRLVKIQ